MKLKPIKRKFMVKVKGIINPPVPYAVNVVGGDWTPYLGDVYTERQKYGVWETDDCWCLSTIKGIEIQLNWLLKNNVFSTDAVSFFTANGYLDQTGSFLLSERFIEILSGNTDNGGTAEEAAQLVAEYGCIPHSQLAYADTQANQFSNQYEFDLDYFNPAAVTDAMKLLGRKFLTYVNIGYRRIGVQFTTPDATILNYFLLQSPLQYGIPVDVLSWNQVNVPINQSTEMAHEVTGYKTIQTDIPIIDNYLPYEKTLAQGYYLPSVIQVVATAIQPQAVPVVQNRTFNQWVIDVWNAFWGLPTSQPVGRVRLITNATNLCLKQFRETFISLAQHDKS